MMRDPAARNKATVAAAVGFARHASRPCSVRAVAVRAVGFTDWRVAVAVVARRVAVDRRHDDDLHWREAVGGAQPVAVVAARGGFVAHDDAVELGERRATERFGGQPRQLVVGQCKLLDQAFAGHQLGEGLRA